MPFTIERNDLAHVSADVIVITANEGLQINGGVGLSVARVAGLAELQAACDALGGCPAGQAVATPAFALSAKSVVHVVGPVWQGGSQGEESVLRQAYDNALACADECGARSIALPLVSAHTFGFPVRLSFVIAVEAIKAFLEDHDDTEVRLVLFGEEALAVGMSFYGNIAQYIDENYVEEARSPRNYPRGVFYEDDRPMQGPQFSARSEQAKAAAASSRPRPKEAKAPSGSRPEYVRSEAMPNAAKRRPGVLSLITEAVEDARDRISELRKPPKDKPHDGTCIVRDEGAELLGPDLNSEQYWQIQDEAENQFDAAFEELAAAPSAFSAATPGAPAPRPADGTLKSWLDQLDAPFSTTLLALIDERGMTDAEVYKRANMSRQLFSKIRCDASYRPTKRTVLALAIALGLDLGETADLLQRAGFALSHSSKADVIVEYFIVNGNYDIFDINEALYAFDQPLL